MPLDRSRLPEPAAFYEAEGLGLEGKGKWLTGRCVFHGGSDSMRVQADSGAFVCMAGCGVKGGDVIAFYMERYCADFIDACKALGAWVEDDRPSKYRQHAMPFTARAALEVVRFETLLCAVAACNLAKGIELASADRERLVLAASRIQFIAEEIAK